MMGKSRIEDGSRKGAPLFNPPPYHNISGRECAHVTTIILVVTGLAAVVSLAALIVSIRNNK